MKKKLCKPCAIKLTNLGLYGKNEKVTCDECGNRRFGCIYEVEFNAENIDEKDRNRTKPS